jgi:hypothetical protein
VRVIAVPPLDNFFATLQIASILYHRAATYHGVVDHCNTCVAYRESTKGDLNLSEHDNITYILHYTHIILLGFTIFTNDRHGSLRGFQETVDGVQPDAELEQQGA